MAGTGSGTKCDDSDAGITRAADEKLAALYSFDKFKICSNVLFSQIILAFWSIRSVANEHRRKKGVCFLYCESLS
jgi:hypothetical protein